MAGSGKNKVTKVEEARLYNFPHKRLYSSGSNDKLEHTIVTVSGNEVRFSDWNIVVEIDALESLVELIKEG